MYQDINGKTGYRNLQGYEFLYGDLKLLNKEEKAAALQDGISEWTKPAKSQPTVEQLKQQTIRSIKSYRDTINNGGVMINGKWFHSDVESKQQQLVLYTLGSNIPAGVQWKTMDGSFVAMDQSLVASIFAAQIQHNLSVFAVSEAHVAAVRNMTLVDEIESYDWKAGFPEIFQDTLSNEVA